MRQLADLRFADHIFLAIWEVAICGANYFLRTSNFRKSANTVYNILSFCIFFGGVECVGHSFVSVAHFIFLRDVWIRTQRLFGLGDKRNLLICDLRINHYKLADLRFADYTPWEFADLRLLNEPKNLRICDLRTKIKKNLRVHLCSPYAISIHLSPSPSKLGRQSCRVT
jgi:hypothetical protein